MEKIDQLKNAYAVASTHVYEDIGQKVQAVSTSLSSLVMAMRHYNSIFGKDMQGFSNFMRITQEDASRVLESASKSLTYARFFDLSENKDAHWVDATATVVKAADAMDDFVKQSMAIALTNRIPDDFPPAAIVNNPVSDMRHAQEQIITSYEAITVGAGKSVYYADFILELQDSIMKEPSFIPSVMAGREKGHVLDFRREAAEDHDAFRRGGIHALAMSMAFR